MFFKEANQSVNKFLNHLFVHQNKSFNRVSVFHVTFTLFVLFLQTWKRGVRTSFQGRGRKETSRTGGETSSRRRRTSRQEETHRGDHGQVWSKALFQLHKQNCFLKGFNRGNAMIFETYIIIQIKLNENYMYFSSSKLNIFCRKPFLILID